MRKAKHAVRVVWRNALIINEIRDAPALVLLLLLFHMCMRSSTLIYPLYMLAFGFMILPTKVKKTFSLSFLLLLSIVLSTALSSELVVPACSHAFIMKCFHDVVCVLDGFVFAMRMWKSGSFCGAVSLLAARKNILNGLRVAVVRSLLRSDFRIIYLVVFCVCFLSTFARHARVHM